MKEQTPKLCIHCHCPIGRCEWGCINYKDMSKEQTPITAQDFLERIGHDKDVICESMFDKPYLQSNVSDLMEQYAQAKVEEYAKEKNKAINNLINTCNEACAEQIQKKVLEALERVQNKATIYGVNVSWIETELKPKYQNKDE